MKAEDRYDSLFQYYAEREGFTGNDWLYFKAQVKAESAFDPNAVSYVGAVGLAQFMPPTWKEWQDGTPGIQAIAGRMELLDPRDPEDAIRTQVWYMKWLLNRVDNSWPLAWAAYNWGIGNVLRIRGNPEWWAKIPAETRHYINRINQYYGEYLQWQLQLSR